MMDMFEKTGPLKNHQRIWRPQDVNEVEYDVDIQEISAHDKCIECTV